MTTRPKNVAAVVDAYGWLEIRRVLLCREVLLPDLIKHALVQKTKARPTSCAHDEVFRVFLDFFLEHGVHLRVQRHDGVTSIANKSLDDTKTALRTCIPIVMPPHATLGTLIRKAEKARPYLWLNASGDSQQFVSSILRKNVEADVDDLLRNVFTQLTQTSEQRGGTDRPNPETDAKIEGAAQDFATFRKKMIDLLGSGETTNLQLEPLGHKLLGHQFLGVFSQDTFPVGQVGMSIVNVDTSDEPGTHWVACVETPHSIFVFDSFARDISKLMPILEANLNRKHVHVFQKRNHASQAFHTDICGQLCLAWLQTAQKNGVQLAMLI